MTYQDLFDKVQAIIEERSSPDNLVGSIVFLIIILGISAIPFLGIPLAILILAATIGAYFK